MRNLMAFVAFSVLPIIAHADAAEDAAVKLERERQQAFLAGDVARLDAETADDYTTINPTGKLSTKPQMMASLKAHKTKVVSVDLQELKARLYGDLAIVTGIYDDVHVTDGVQATIHARFTRVFVKRGGKWLAVAYQQTAIAP